jgi:hypothetical protein
MSRTTPLAGYISDSTGSYTTVFLIMSGLILTARLGPFFVCAAVALEHSREIRDAPA